MIPFLFLLFGLPLLGAFLPTRASRLYYGCFALLYAIFWLDSHVSSTYVDSDRLGVAGSFMFFWFWLGVIALAIRLVRDALLNAGVEEPSRQSNDGWLSWPLPAGLTLALLGFHSLSNRMAGFTPAWAAHVIVVALAATALLTISSAGVRRRLPFAFRLGAAAFLIGSIALTANAARDGFALAARARDLARGKPYCVLAFAGTNKPRRATGAFDLSRLVNRAHGRYAVDGSTWLFVKTPSGWGPFDEYWLEGGTRFPRDPNATLTNMRSCGPA